MTDTPDTTPDPQPTREATELVRVLREWSARSGYRIWHDQDAAALIDQFAAQHSTAAPVSGDARMSENGREDADRLCTRPDPPRSTNSLPERGAPVSGDARERVERLLAVLMTVVPLDHQWRTNLRDMAIAALTAERAEGRRAALEEAMGRLMRIYINEAPADMTQAQAANWAMGIAQDEIRRLADTPACD